MAKPASNNKNPETTWIDKWTISFHESCKLNGLSSHIPFAIIQIILEFSEHWAWTEYEPIWNKNGNKKSKYIRIYDIHSRQIRLILQDVGTREEKPFKQSILSKTHFARFDDDNAIISNAMRTRLTLHLFDFSSRGNRSTVIHGCIRIGLVSNIYCKNRSLYNRFTKCESKKDKKLSKFERYLSNGNCFVGLYSEVVFNDNKCGIYYQDCENSDDTNTKTNRAAPVLAQKNRPLEWGERIEITIDRNGRAQFKRLYYRDHVTNKAKIYDLQLPRVNRFKKEKWYPCVSFNCNNTQNYVIGCQIVNAAIL